MNLLKGVFIFLIAFFTACILIFTFMQEPFRQLVPGRIVFWSTPAIPIYAYVAGAFALGLAIGLLMTIYYVIVLKAKLHRQNRAIKDLEERLSLAQQQSAPALQAGDAETDDSRAIAAGGAPVYPAPDVRNEGGLS